MTKALDFDSRVEKMRRRSAVHSRLSNALTAALAEMREGALRADVEEMHDWVYAHDQLVPILLRIKESGRKNVNISEFLDPKCPLYGKRIGILHGLHLRTLLQFLQSPLGELKGRFEKEMVVFPQPLALVHRAYERLQQEK